jgi:putative endopeptidase
MTQNGSPQRSGIDLTNVTQSTRPQDDLFRHVNGEWLKNSIIPEDQAAYGTFYVLRDLSESRSRAIIEDLSTTQHPPGSNEQKIGDLYRSFMDEERIERQGVSTVADDLTRAQGVRSLAEFIDLLGSLEARGNPGVFASFVTTDRKDSTTNIIYLNQGGLSLPDEAYYRVEEYATIRSEFLNHVERMFDLAEISSGAEHATRVLALETRIASLHWDRVANRDAELTYNKRSFDDLRHLSGDFPWSQWLTASDTPARAFSQVVVRQPSFFEGLGPLLDSFDTPAWSSWLTWQVLSNAAPFLSSAFAEESFAFNGTTLSGIPALKERWKRGVRLVEGALGEALGQIYVDRHFPPRAKSQMVELVGDLVEAYRIDISALEWMTEPTKQCALEKLSKFTPKIGYPDKWRDYTALEIDPDDLRGNIARAAKFEVDYNFAKIGAPVDRTEWHMTPQTVNAYYNPGMNEIVFPAAILQPPFFDPDADSAVNYGGIGAVIGHEIGHGFDDQGSKFDGDGNMENWWSDADRVEFEARANKLIAQYDQLCPEEAADVHVNGALTIGENIGDLGGLTIAHKAYELSLKGAPAPAIGELTGSQRFFYGWAQVWCAKTRPEEVRRRIATDPHSPAEFRCNQIVRNLTEFYDAFRVTKSDALFLPDEDRVRIW